MNPTVLVVEDDLEINELIGEYLGIEDMKYLQATTGERALELAAATHPDAIVLDLMLPDIHGFQVASALSSKRASYDIPIVILSCMCQAIDRERGFSAGALAYMNKPFLPDDLLSSVRRAFEWHDSLKLRPPAGSLLLCEKDPAVFPKALRQMLADIFTRTDLSDAAVGGIRQAAETLAAWACRWNAEQQADIKVRLDYKINPQAPHDIEWKLSESAKGLIAEAFFKTPPVSAAAGLIGWGGNLLSPKPAPLVPPSGPPPAWQQILAQFGARRFERDPQSQSVRFTRAQAAPEPADSHADVIPHENVCHA